MRILLVGAADNALGRTYCLWLLTRHLGWSSTVYGLGEWAPVAGHGFRVRPLEDLTGAALKQSDVLVVYQPLPETLGRVMPHALQEGVPVVVDVDDPHWEQRYGYGRLHQLRVTLGMLRRGRNPMAQFRLRHTALQLQILNASPYVRDRWPGHLIPHVREPTSSLDWPDLPLRAAFVGTPRQSKGVEIARQAAHITNTQLTVTAPPPRDPMPNEHWVGQTSLAEGLELVATSHVSLVPSIDSPWSRRQFPVKVVDAMMAGRVVVGSDLPPIRWAVGNCGILVRPGSASALADALTRLQSTPQLMMDLGERARERAVRKFTPAAVAPTFASAMMAASSSNYRHQDDEPR